jgi:4-amino-4-deoxy-L-arabinose transferase-like glycosyltransferase
VLFHWLQLACIRLFGESEFAFRLPTAMAGVVLVMVTRWLAAEMFGATVGNMAAVMFVTTPFTFALANVALFDMVYTTFLFGAVACLTAAIAHGRQRLQYVAYVLLTLAIMTKGPVALLLVLLWGGAAFSNAALRQSICRLQWRTGLLLVVVLASPWFVYMWAVFDGQFVREYLLAGNLWYFTGPRVFSSRVGDYGFYIRTFLGAFFPWSVVAVGYAAHSISTWRRTREPLSSEELLLWIWVAVVVTFFSIARFKLDWYIFPVAPACSILAARGWSTLGQRRALMTRTAVAIVAAALVIGGAVAAIAVFQLNLPISRAAVVLPLVLAMGGLIMGWQIIVRRFVPPPSLAIPVVALLVAYGTVVVIGFPVLERSRPTAPIGRWVRRHTPVDTTLGIFGLNDWRASIRYYSDRPVAALRSRSEVQAFLNGHHTSYVLMLRRDFESIAPEDGSLMEVSSRPAIVGRSGKYLRRQVWGKLVIVTHRDNQAALTARDDLDDQH